MRPEGKNQGKACWRSIALLCCPVDLQGSCERTMESSRCQNAHPDMPSNPRPWWQVSFRSSIVRGKLTARVRGSRSLWSPWRDAPYRTMMHYVYWQLLFSAPVAPSFPPDAALHLASNCSCDDMQAFCGFRDSRLRRCDSTCTVRVRAVSNSGPWVSIWTHYLCQHSCPQLKKSPFFWATPKGPQEGGGLSKPCTSCVSL